MSEEETDLNPTLSLMNDITHSLWESPGESHRAPSQFDLHDLMPYGRGSNYDELPYEPAEQSYDTMEQSYEPSLDNTYPTDPTPFHHTPIVYDDTVRPEVIFTPLVSPAVTPLDGPTAHARPPGFEPLTLPALEAVDVPAPEPASATGIISYPRAYMRSPMILPLQGTPKTRRPKLLQGISKSPVIVAKRLLVSTKVEGKLMADLEEFTVPNPPRRLAEPPNESMMTYTMNRVLANKRTSPDLGAAANSVKPPTRPRRKSSSTNVAILPKQVPVPGSLAAQLALKMAPPKNVPKPDPKRQLHKLAEQGRRDRMNMAIQELYTLLPLEFIEQYQQMKTRLGEVIIPSKATTVEVACEYIRWLSHPEDSGIRECESGSTE